MFKTKNFWYISLFVILYLITAGSSFFHAISFFGLANNSWMSIILAFAFEVGQAAVLFSLLTSKKDRSRFMPWVLMTMFTLVQVVGNVFSSYKHIILNSVEDLKYFKEPIFIWTSLPDQEATVIVTWAIGAILPIAALLLTSMITNYLSDQEEIKELENKENETNKTSRQIQNSEEISEENKVNRNQTSENGNKNESGKKLENKLTDSENQEIIKADEGEIFDLPKEELLKPNVEKKTIDHLEGIDKEQIENLIKNGIKEDKQESEKVSHFINQ